MAVEKEEDSERTQHEAMRLDSQADKLADTLDEMEHQRTRLDRKIAVLEGNEVRHSIRLLEAKQAILTADYDGYEDNQNQLIVLMDQVEAKSRKADLNRARAYDLALAGIDNRIHGNRIRATQELRKMERWMDEAIILDIEMARHSNQLMRLKKRIEVTESMGRRAQTIKKDLEYNLIIIAFNLSTARCQREELKQSFETNRKLFLQLRDEFQRFELVTILESDNADDLRKQAEAAERSAECARKSG